MKVGVHSILGEPDTPAIVTIPVPTLVPVVSSHAVGIISSIRSSPTPPAPWSIITLPSEGMSIVIEEDENVFLSACVIATEKVVPLSSSPEPPNVKPESIPIGFPVVVFSFDAYVAVAPPDIVIEPALADATTARDPHKADRPIFVNLSIVNSFVIFLFI